MRRVVFTFRSILLGSLAAALLNGCQQMAWKPGASASDLQRDTAACRAPNDDEAAVQNCLRQRGWVIRQAPVDKDAEAADDTETTDSVSDAVGAITRPAAATAPGLSKEPPVSQGPPVSKEPIVTTTVPARDKLVPVSAGSTAVAATAQTTNAPPPKPAAAKKPKVIDPLKPKMIQSWWKAGAGAADLAADQTACVDTLGAAHKPDQQKRLYTYGMIECLRGRGWSGF